MTAPQRIQRKRTKGFKMPPNTVSVTRPGKWGNPYRGPNFTAAEAVAAFRHAMEAIDTTPNLSWLRLRGHLSQLRGKNLACWCPIDQPCHATVLLELANKPVCEAA